MTPLVLATFLLADPVPHGARATAARVEADAFAALEEKRDCDAAAAFVHAAELGADDRLLMNAGLAFARAGDRRGALATFARIVDPALVPSAAQRSNAIVEEARRMGPGARCPAPAASASSMPSSSIPSSSSMSSMPSSLAPVPAPGAAPSSLAPVIGPNVAPPPSSSAPSSSARSSSAPASSVPSLLPWGIAAVASGVAVAGSAAGIWILLDQTVLQNPSSSGAAKSAALGSSPALIAGGSIGGLLVITGVTLIPVSFGEAS